MHSQARLMRGVAVAVVSTFLIVGAAFAANGVLTPSGADRTPADDRGAHRDRRADRDGGTDRDGRARRGRASRPRPPSRARRPRRTRRPSRPSIPRRPRPPRPTPTAARTTRATRTPMRTTARTRTPTRTTAMASTRTPTRTTASTTAATTVRTAAMTAATISGQAAAATTDRTDPSHRSRVDDRHATRWVGPPQRIMGAGRPTASDAERGPASRRPSISDPGATLPEQPDDRAGDRAIVEAVLAGDRDAFRRLVERESGPVVRACHRILGDLHEAEDAAQEAFVTAYRSLASWRGDGPFGAWLTRIAIRIALRQAGRRKTVTWRDPLADRARSVGGPDRRGHGPGLARGDRHDGPFVPRGPGRARDGRPGRGRLAPRAVSGGRHAAVLRGDEPRGDRRSRPVDRSRPSRPTCTAA